jgi:hypothetical protein
VFKRLLTDLHHPSALCIGVLVQTVFVTAFVFFTLYDVRFILSSGLEIIFSWMLHEQRQPPGTKWHNNRYSKSL